MMIVGTDGQQKRTLFSPNRPSFGNSPAFSPMPSPLGRSPGFSPNPVYAYGKCPKTSPLKRPPGNSKNQDNQEISSTCCTGCFRTGSPPPPTKTYHQTTKNSQLVEQEREIRQREARVTFMTKMNEYISPRRSSPLLIGSQNLVALTSQAKINGWHIEPHEIELHEQVGRGSTADIFRGSWKGLNVAVKCMNPDFFEFNESGVTFFVQEIETLSKQRHPFVLRLVGACLYPPQQGWVITEFLSTTLKEWLHGYEKRSKVRSIPLPPFEERIAKALEISQAMQYLHDQQPMLIHRDLKPSNIFMDDASHIRVADFGHARFLSEGEKALTGETGTYVYMAPEVIRCEPYNEKCDVFSFAIILNELVSGQHPYIETDYGPTEIAIRVAEGKLRPAFPKDNGQLDDLIDLIRCSWDEDASIRPSFAIISCTLKRIQEKLIKAYESEH